MPNSVPPFNVDSVRARLPGRRIDWFESLDSTMIEARRDMQPGRIVGAEEQTAGMGRHGRKWISEPGAGLYVSMVLAAKPVPVVMLALGLAARHAIGWRRDLRWPNDVLLNGKKCAGVLAQLEGETIIAGIGINVSQTEFPDDLETPATSLLLEGVTRLARRLAGGARWNAWIVTHGLAPMRFCGSSQTLPATFSESACGWKQASQAWRASPAGSIRRDSCGCAKIMGRRPPSSRVE